MIQGCSYEQECIIPQENFRSHLLTYALSDNNSDDDGMDLAWF